MIIESDAQHDCGSGEGRAPAEQDKLIDAPLGGPSVRGHFESFAAYRLPRGRHGLPAEFVAENQRWRLLGAAAQLLTERPYITITPETIASAAGVSRRTFYDQFDNLADCFLATYELGAGCLLDVVSRACEGSAAGSAALRCVLEQTLAFFASEPALANLLGPALPATSPDIAAARDRLLDRLLGSLQSARAPRASGLSNETERRLIAATLTLVSERIGGGETAALPGLASELQQLLGGFETPKAS